VLARGTGNKFAASEEHVAVHAGAGSCAVASGGREGAGEGEPLHNAYGGPGAAAGCESAGVDRPRAPQHPPSLLWLVVSGNGLAAAFRPPLPIVTALA